MAICWIFLASSIKRLLSKPSFCDENYTMYTMAHIYICLLNMDLFVKSSYDIIFRNQYYWFVTNGLCHVRKNISMNRKNILSQLLSYVS